MARWQCVILPTAAIDFDFLVFAFHSCAEASRSGSEVHSFCTKDRCPSTDFIYSRSICVSIPDRWAMALRRQQAMVEVKRIFV